MLLIVLIVPDHKYIREEIQHRPVDGAKYGRDTNYGAKVFVGWTKRHKFSDIPTGDAQNPQAGSLYGWIEFVQRWAHIVQCSPRDALLHSKWLTQLHHFELIHPRRSYRCSLRR